MDNAMYGAGATGKGSDGDDARLASPGAEDEFAEDDGAIVVVPTEEEEELTQEGVEGDGIVAWGEQERDECKVRF